MAVEWQNGLPILTDQSLIGDVPEYTQLLNAARPFAIGMVQAFAVGTTSLMPYWLPCDGREVPNEPRYTKLRELFAAASTPNPFGEINGNPRVPDLQGRVIISEGKDGSSENNTNRGFATKLGDTRVGQHTHPITDNVHGHHAMSAAGSQPLANWTVGMASHLSGGSQFGLTSNNATGNNTTQGVNGAGGHGNMQPSLVLRYAIFAAFE